MSVGLSLKANLRSKTGKAEAGRARNQAQIPAVIYNKNGNANINVAAKELEQQYHKGNLFTTIVEIELDGKKITVIPHKIDLHPVTDRIIHVDFAEVVKGKKVKAKVKINFANKDKSPGLKKGGFLHIVLRKIEVLCNSDAIPETITIDVGTSQVGSKIRAQNVKLPNGVELADKDNFIIASVIGRGSKDEEEATAATAEGAAPAAGAATAGDAKAATPAKGAAPADKKEADKKPAKK